MAVMALQAVWMWAAQSQPRTSSLPQALSPLYLQASLSMAKRCAAEWPGLSADHSACIGGYTNTAEYQSIHAVPLCTAWYRPSTTCYPPHSSKRFPCRFFTSDHALKLEWVPDWIAIIGSGYIGLEFSDVYTALGSEVTFIEVCSICPCHCPLALYDQMKKVTWHVKVAQ